MATTAIGLLPAKAALGAEQVGHDVKAYKTLGRTGLRISDISFGSSRLRTGEEDLVKYALDRGVNYFDTAESYTDGASETVLGNALRGKRDKVYVVSKVSAGASERKESMMSALEGSLGRLQTDYVDIYFNHAVNDIARLDNPEWREFTESAKKQERSALSGCLDTRAT
jgi:aryl-alcohol dehydrogenase-like predicted oxidoreductase